MRDAVDKERYANVRDGANVDENARYNRAMIDVNKISTVFGRDDLRAYIAREIKKGNLVRIKKRSTPISDVDAVIAKRYERDTSSTSITENSKMSTDSAEALLLKDINSEIEVKIESPAPQTAIRGIPAAGWEVGLSDTIISLFGK